MYLRRMEGRGLRRFDQYDEVNLSYQVCSLPLLFVCCKVREFKRKTGALEGEAWRMFDHLPSGKVYKSLRSAITNGFAPPRDVPDLD